MASRHHSRTQSASSAPPRNDVRRQLFKGAHLNSQSTSAIPHAHLNSLNPHVPTRSRTYHHGTSANNNANNLNPFEDHDNDSESSSDIVIDEKDGGNDVALMALMMEKMIKPQEMDSKQDHESLLADSIHMTNADLRKKSPLLLRAIQDVLKMKVTSLQTDNWMYEAEDGFAP